MRSILKISNLLLLSVITLLSKGQDIHFSQYLNNPLSYNPSNTGKFDGDWRFIANYRDQWRAISIPFTTYSASFDRQFYYKNRHLSAGVFVLSDQSGDIALKSNQIYVSGAYHMEYNKNFFDYGVQLGYVMKRIDYGSISFPDQWDQVSGYFNPELQTDALIQKDHLGYLDMNVGAAWHKKIRIFEPEVGVSLSHVNLPRETFFNDKGRLPMRRTIHGALNTEIMPNLHLKPGFLFLSMRGANDFVLGTEIGYGITGNRFNINEIQGGVFWRNGIIDVSDAMVFSLGAQVSNWAFNVSYDFNVSPLNKFTNHRGAFEISFVYKSISTIIKKFTIPCERI